MKVLIVSHQFFPEFYTGTERFSLNLAHQLQRMGHGVEVVTYGVKDDSGRFDNRSGNILWWEYVYEGLKVTAIKHRGQPARLNFSVFNEAVLSFFRDFLSGKEFDVVHLTHPMRVGAVAIAAKERHLPCVLTLTDFWLLCPNSTMLKSDYSLCFGPKGGEVCAGSCFGRSMTKELTSRYADCEKLLTMVDTICAPSRFLAGMFRASYPNISVEVIRHGIDYRWLPGVGPAGVKKREHDRIRFCYLGTILRHKGVDVLIRAFRSVSARNIRLDIYGGYFHERAFYEKLAALSGDDDRITFRGEYEHREVGDILAETDGVLVPSVWWENSPLTILTSFAYRVPVIASDIGGMAEFVENEVNGYTFQMGNSKALAAVIEKIAVAPQTFRNMQDGIKLPPRIEEEAFKYEDIYSRPPSSDIKNVEQKAADQRGHSFKKKTFFKKKRQNPNFFVVGAAKSGTTSLFHYLKQHPEVFLTPIKEPNFFCKDINARTFSDGYLKSVCPDVDAYLEEPKKTFFVAHIRKWKQYKKLYQGVDEEKAIGEMSNSYLYSKVAARKIYAKYPKAKIVMVLRNPIDRAFSHFMMALNISGEEMDQEKAEAVSFIDRVEEDRLQAHQGWGISNLYIELGRYYEQVRRYFKRFPSKNVEVILYDEYRRSPLDTLKHLFHFIGVNEFIDVDVTKKHNPAKYKRSITDEERAYLAPFFREDIAKLSDLIQRDLSLWLQETP